MTRPTQASAELAHVAALIEGMPIAMLTHVEPDGAWVSRPMAVLEMDAQGALWFFTDLRSCKPEHLRAASLSFADTALATYVSLSGRGEIDTDRARILRLWTNFARPWVAQGPDSPDLALLKFVPDTVDYWDGSSSRMVRAYGVLARVAAGKPLAMAEHGSLGSRSAPAVAAAVVER